MEQANSKAERTRQFIIESTAEIFNRKGYAGTSLTDLTEATKLTKGSIYGNFENKEAVAAAAFDYNWAAIRSRIDAKMAACTTAKEKLLAYTDVYKSVGNGAFARGGCPLLNTAVDADDTNPLLKERALQAFNGWKQRITSLIKKGIADGEFREDTNVQQVALILISLIEGGIMIAKLTGSVDALKIILNGVAREIEAICN